MILYRCMTASPFRFRHYTAPSWQEFFSRFAALVGAASVRPLNAVHMTAGHNALRGSGPDQQLAFKNAMADVGVLIAGSTSSALRAVRPPNLHITPVVRRDLAHRASATGSLYRSPLAIMAQTIRAILLASAMAATLVGRLTSKAVSQGRCLVPWTLA
jgi:hypothetical protein